MRTSLRNLAFVGLCLSLLPACEGPAPASPPAAAPAASVLAKLRGLKGPVTLERDGRKRPAAEESLYGRDVVETGAASEAQILFTDGRTIEVGPDARVTIGEDATGLLLQVDRGFILSRVPNDAKAAPGGGVALQILTPFGLTRVGSGQSEVSIAVGKDDAKVEVKLGDVELVARNGQSTKAGAGDQASLTAGEVQVQGAQKEAPKPDLMLEPIQVIVYADGQAELKKAGERRWKQVGKSGAPLAEGDSVRVKRGRSTLQLQGSGTALTLSSGGELVLGKSTRSADGDDTALDLRKGALDLALSKTKSRVRVGDTTLESDGGGYFHIQKTKDGIEVSAVTGDLVLRRGDVAQPVRAGETARLGGRGAAGEVQRRSLPELVLPSRTGLRVYHPGVGEALLDWRGEDGDYQVRVAEDAAFSRLVLDGVVHQSQVAVEIPRRGALYWDVKDASGAWVDSGSASFMPEPPLRDLERLRNEVPEGPDKTTIYFQDKPPAVTFTYAEEPGAAKYKVAVFRAGQLDSPVAERLVEKLAAPLEAGALGEGSYFWSVTPLSSGGDALRGGRMNKLDLVYDNSVASLLVRAPLNGARVSGAARTQGVAPVGAKLYINGRAAELDDKSRFDTSVQPVGQPAMIIYRLARPNAADAYYVRTVKRSRG